MTRIPRYTPARYYRFDRQTKSAKAVVENRHSQVMTLLLWFIAAQSAKHPGYVRRIGRSWPRRKERETGSARRTEAVAGVPVLGPGAHSTCSRAVLQDNT